MHPRTLILAVVLFGLISSTSHGAISAIWANDGGDKVTQDELRATQGIGKVMNMCWNGTRISVFGARNEVVSFNAILEAGKGAATNVSVSLSGLKGPSGVSIQSAPAAGNSVFNWVGRPIELFYVRYLQIKGISMVSYETYDERHAPIRFRRPWTGAGMGKGNWTDRPDHDKFYPEIAVPLELVPRFTIANGQNQSIWVDIYIPKNTPEGLYKGTLNVQEPGVEPKSIPVELTVMAFTLPDMPTLKTMLYYSPPNLNRRYIGRDSVNANTADGDKAKRIRDRHFMVAHRHRISLINDPDDSCTSKTDQPCPEWIPRLDGSLFTAGNGYDGPGVNTGNNVYSIGTYGSWSWKKGTKADMQRHADAWANWFEKNAPSTEYFLYLSDESPDTKQTEQWARWILDNPGPGNRLKSFATIPLNTAASGAPALDVPASTLTAAPGNPWQTLTDRYTSDSRKRFYLYNGHRPATGSFATEDDGVALRALAWAHYKKRISRWFFWEATYYNNYQGNTGQINVFRTAHTFGNRGTVDAMKGEAGWNYSNGDGVLMYPGTDLLFPADSYGVDGPFVSLRLKAWRRGIQDAEYLAMAASVSPAAAQAAMNTLVPKVLWENGVTDANDPTWVRTDISWPVDPDKWESSRLQLATLAAQAKSGVAQVTADVHARVYPNPWRADKHFGYPVSFAEAPPGGQIKLFTVAAHLVRTLTVLPDGTAQWDLKTDSGDDAASGLYLYIVESIDGQKARGKVALIR